MNNLSLDGEIGTALGIFGLIVLYMILKKLTALLSIIYLIHQELREALYENGNPSPAKAYLRRLHDEVSAIDFKVHQIQHRQEKGPWEPSEPS